MEYTVFIICDSGYQLVSTHTELPVLQGNYHIELYDKVKGTKTIIQECY